jgi:hypothetical protein
VVIAASIRPRGCGARARREAAAGREDREASIAVGHGFERSVVGPLDTTDEHDRVAASDFGGRTHPLGRTPFGRIFAAIISRESCH